MPNFRVTFNTAGGRIVHVFEALTRDHARCAALACCLPGCGVLSVEPCAEDEPPATVAVPGDNPTPLSPSSVQAPHPSAAV